MVAFTGKVTSKGGVPPVSPGITTMSTTITTAATMYSQTLLFAVDKVGVTQLVLRLLACASLPSRNQVDCCWLCAGMSDMVSD